MKPIHISKLDKVIVGQDTHEGETGKNNEDSGGFFAFQISEQDRTEVYLGIVADGIGGHQAGERASRLGIAVVEQYFRQVNSPDLRQHFQESFHQANTQIVNEGQSNPKLRGMGTTMTAAAIMDGKLYIANVGDSRAYLIRNGTIQQLSVDHTWAQEAIEAGRLTPEEARQHPNRNVIKRYMGIQAAMEVDFRVANPDDPSQMPSETNQGFSLRRGDTILLCSDGLSDMISDGKILEETLRNPPQEAAEQLVLRAREAGGYDNITVVIMQVPGRRKKPVAAATPTAAGAKKRSFPVLGVLVILALVVAAALAFGPVMDFLGGEATPTTAPLATVPPTATTAPTNTPAPLATATVAAVEAATAPPTATETATPEPTETEAALATPTSVPTSMAALPASGPPTLSMTPAPTMPARAIIEPTDRSMPPEMMTAVIPMAMMPLTLERLSTLRKFSAVRNVSGSRADRAAISSASVAKGSSCRMNLLI